MNHKKNILLVLGFFLLCGGMLFAQKGGNLNLETKNNQQSFNLMVQVDVGGYSILLDGARVKGNNFRLPPGNHSIIVRVPGYREFAASINLQSDQVIDAHLTAEVRDANLFVNSNVKGAQVYINDTLVGIIGARFTIPEGAYQLRVSAPGYQDFMTQIQINGNQTVNAILTPIGATLTVNSNVNDAQVFINNNAVGTVGASFSLPPGKYQVRVSAPGYLDFVTSIGLNGNQTVNANLTPLAYNLTVSANVKGAQVFINNNAVGATDQTYSLQPGSYQLRVSAPGFQDFQAQIQLNGNQAVSAVLLPFSGTLVVEMPRNTAMQVFIDGNIQKRLESLTLPAGQHRVRFELGFMVAETLVSITAGQTVTVAPVFSIMVK